MAVVGGEVGRGNKEAAEEAADHNHSAAKYTAYIHYLHIHAQDSYSRIIVSSLTGHDGYTTEADCAHYSILVIVRQLPLELCFLYVYVELTPSHKADG